MDIEKIADNVKSKEDFIKFLNAFIDNYIHDKENWENPELGRYMEAMERYLTDFTDQSLEKIDFTPSWSLFARIMIAASIYE